MASEESRAMRRESRKRLIVIIGRPACDKAEMAMALARKLEQHGVGCALINREAAMSQQLWHKASKELAASCLNVVIDCPDGNRSALTKIAPDIARCHAARLVVIELVCLSRDDSEGEVSRKENQTILREVGHAGAVQAVKPNPSDSTQKDEHADKVAWRMEQQVSNPQQEVIDHSITDHLVLVDPELSPGIAAQDVLDWLRSLDDSRPVFLLDP